MSTVILAISLGLASSIDLPPAPPPDAWQGLIGEYGWESQRWIIFEQAGRLWIAWSDCLLEPLNSASDSRFLPEHFSSLPGGEIRFRRDSQGQATAISCGGMLAPRRPVDGEGGKTFRIQPRHPVEQLRKESIAASPPVEGGFFRPADLTDLVQLDPSIHLDIRYATTNNFMSAPLYTSARAFLQRPAAEALLKAHRQLQKRGYGLLIHDGYRPWYVTRMFWEATPDPQRIFVADPSRGSRHNRGCAVDLSLYDRKTGAIVPMVSGYDEFSERAYPNYVGGTSRQRWHRELLRQAMEAEGFTVYENEWWHFDYKDWKAYPILNVRFEDLKKTSN